MAFNNRVWSSWLLGDLAASRQTGEEVLLRAKQTHKNKGVGESVVAWGIKTKHKWLLSVCTLREKWSGIGGSSDLERPFRYHPSEAVAQFLHQTGMHHSYLISTWRQEKVSLPRETSSISKVFEPYEFLPLPGHVCFLQTFLTNPCLTP